MWIGRKALEILVIQGICWVAESATISKVKSYHTRGEKRAPRALYQQLNVPVQKWHRSLLLPTHWPEFVIWQTEIGKFHNCIVLFYYGFSCVSLMTKDVKQIFKWAYWPLDKSFLRNYLFKFFPFFYWLGAFLSLWCIISIYVLDYKFSL